MGSSLDSSLSSSSSLSLLKLRYLKRAKLFPMSLSQLSFSKLLSLAAQAFPETQNGLSSGHLHTATHIEISYFDEDGDSVVIDSDESLDLAVLSFQKAQAEVIKLQIHVKNAQNITYDHDIARKSHTPMSAYFGSSSARCLHTPCQHFQAGLCRFGSSCRFLHHSTCNKTTSSKSGSLLNEFETDKWSTMTCNKTTSSKSGSLLDEFEIDKWLMVQRRASEDENISYLNSQEGYDSLMQILNYPNLPLITIYQLASLLTRPRFRTSLLKEETENIYNCFIGSQFLIALRSHIRTSVKPILGCVEPYVFLCEEIVGQTSNGWKEVPLDELQNLVYKVKNGSAKELSYIIAQLLDHRAAKKMDEEFSADI